MSMGREKSFLFLISGLEIRGFLMNCVEVTEGDGAPSMRHPCRVTAKLPSMAISPGGFTVHKKTGGFPVRLSKTKKISPCP